MAMCGTASQEQPLACNDVTHDMPEPPKFLQANITAPSLPH